MMGIITVIISASKMTMNYNGTEISYNLYEDHSGVYMYLYNEAGEAYKDYLAFGDGYVKIANEAYTRDGNPIDEDQVAKLPASLQGTYMNTSMRTIVIVYESSVVIIDGSGKTAEYTLYEDSDGIYII